MHVHQPFNITPLAHVLKLVTLGPLLLISPSVLAQTIIENGGSKTIDVSTAPDSYELRTGGKLTANGASTNQIRANTGSSMTLNGTTVTALGSTNGVDLVASQATIANGSNVSSARTGLVLGQSAG